MSKAAILGHRLSLNLHSEPYGKLDYYLRTMPLLLLVDLLKAEGAVVGHQEDNAPPHQEGDFHAWLLQEFTQRGWRLELQGSATGPLHECVGSSLCLCQNNIRIYCKCSTTRWLATTGFGK
jgi:hypothetical protein